MKAFLLIAALLFGVTQASAADSTKKFYLEDDGSVTLRVEKVEAKVAELEKRVAALESPKLTRPIVNPLTPDVKAEQKFKTVRMQTCTNGVCTVQYVQVPDDGSDAIGNPCPMGQCTDCQCASMSGTSARTGWYLGKRLGR